MTRSGLPDFNSSTRRANDMDVSAVKKPINTAKGLPNEFYIDHEVFELEKEKIFFAGWTAITFGKEVSNIGDAKPLELLGIPLLVVRGEDKNIKVFQNTCRHRGMILVQEKKNIKGAIRCPYHSWCYSTKGELKTTPHVGGPGQNTHPDMDRTALGLVSIRSHVWRDVVFVNISGTAEPFEIVNKDLMKRWAEFEQPIYHGGADSSFKLEIHCNWKLAVENYCESYHLPWVHPGLNSYSRLEDHYNIEKPGEYSGQGSLVYNPLLSSDGERFDDFPGLSEHWNKAAEYIALAPNVLLGVHRDHAFAIILEPLSNSKTREHIEIYYASSKMAESGFSDLRRKNTMMWKEVFEEDIFVVEGMQRGRHGRYFDGGKFSPVMEGPTHLFHRWVADRMS